MIHTIRHSQTVDTARKNLMANFQFTEIQAQAILDMQLRRLAALERKKLQEEFAELKKRIAYLEDLLAHPHKILGVIQRRAGGHHGRNMPMPGARRLWTARVGR